MAARAETLGDTGLNAPGGLATPDLHTIVILLRGMRRNMAVCFRAPETDLRLSGRRGPLFLNLHALPPFGYAHEHYQDKYLLACCQCVRTGNKSLHLKTHIEARRF